jgi:hypothetical protein
VYIVNVNSGKCLDVTGGGTGNNVNVEQYDCMGVPNEEWWLVPVLTGGYQIRSGHAGLCLNRAGGSSADNTNVQQYQCVGSPDAEYWDFFPLSDGTFEIHTPGTNQCLDIAWGSTANGGNAQMYTCIGVANEHWILKPVWQAPRRVRPTALVDSPPMISRTPVQVTPTINPTPVVPDALQRLPTPVPPDTLQRLPTPVPPDTSQRLPTPVAPQ